MSAAGEAATKLDSARLRQKCQEMITYAERLKSNLAGAAQPSTKLLSPSQQQTSPILQQGSLLHGNNFPIWQDEPRADEFQLLPGQSLFMCVAPTTLQLSEHATKRLTDIPLFLRDDTEFPLSTNQTDNFAAWIRPRDLFRLNEQDGRTICEKAMMQVSVNSNLVQDITTDCSVVASLSAAFKVLTGKHAVRMSFGSHVRLIVDVPR
jgi:hypothetical protein